MAKVIDVKDSKSRRKIIHVAPYTDAKVSIIDIREDYREEKKGSVTKIIIDEKEDWASFVLDTGYAIVIKQIFKLQKEGIYQEISESKEGEK